MRIAKIIAAAGLTVAALTAATSADAQRYRSDHYRSYDRGYNSGWDRHHRWERHHRHCTTQWRHHRRVTVCYR